MTSDDEELQQRAQGAAMAAYAPYSHFRVGAAVRAGGRVFTGCNIENASYGLAICAERVAIFKAVASGARRIDALALCCADAGPGAAGGGAMPCGACRQVMAEFGDAGLAIHVAGVGSFKLGQLLPLAFTLAEQCRDEIEEGKRGSAADIEPGVEFDDID